MSIALCQNIARFLIDFLPSAIRNLFDLHMHGFCTLNSCSVFAKKRHLNGILGSLCCIFCTFYRIYTTYRAFCAFCRTFHTFFAGIFAPLSELFAPLSEHFALFAALFTPFTEPSRLLLNFHALY